MHSPSSWVSCPMHSMRAASAIPPALLQVGIRAGAEILAVVLQEQSLVDIEMPGQYMNGDEPSPDGIVFMEGISSNVHVNSLAAPLKLILFEPSLCATGDKLRW